MNADAFRIALAQTNPTVGAIDANLASARAKRAEAAAAGAHLVALGELHLSGYPPEDLVLRPAFVAACMKAVEQLAADTADGGPAIIVGSPWRAPAPNAGSGREALAHNAAILCADGAVKAVIAKHALPNYGVFDEKRVFEQGPIPGPIRLRLGGEDVRLGVMICEDMWIEDVAEGLEESGAELLLVINGSPFDEKKYDVRQQVAVARGAETDMPLLYVNQVGGQDELVFDGASFALDQKRRLVAQAPSFEEALLVTDWRRGADGRIECAAEGALAPPPGRFAAIYQAMVLGLRDYVEKNGFPGVVLGLSGGVDSGLSLVIAVDALGPERVRAVAMPSRYTSEESLEDAADGAKRVGARLDRIDIEPAVEAYDRMLAPLFDGHARDVTEENLQARIRGQILMAISNKLGPMVLTTGNKSEMSVGYATLYGDMCGGYSVLKDAYKSTVFALCRYRNREKPALALGPEGEVVPPRVIEKPPSAELRPEQKDEDSLGSYEVLDAILEALIEHHRSPRELVEAGHPKDAVARASNLLDLAEYKRRQAPPGVKISRRAFGRDRRYPITNAYRKIGVAALDD